MADKLTFDEFNKKYLEDRKKKKLIEKWKDEYKKEIDALGNWKPIKQSKS